MVNRKILIRGLYLSALITSLIFLKCTVAANTNKYLEFDNTLKLWVQDPYPRAEKTAEKLLAFVAKDQSEEQWACLFIGYSKFINLVIQNERKQYQNRFAIDRPDYDYRFNIWNYDKNKTLEIMNCFKRASQYKYSEVSAHTEILLLCLAGLQVEPNSIELKKQVLSSISTLGEQLKFSTMGHVLRYWYNNNSQNTSFSIEEVEALLNSGSYSIYSGPLEEIVSPIELYQKAEYLFDQKRFDDAIEYYGYAGYYYLKPGFGTLTQWESYFWKTSDGIIPDEERWKNLTLLPITANKISECYEAKAEIILRQDSMSQETAKQSGIEFFKTAIFYRWLAALWQEELLESSENQIIQLRIKIKGLETQLNQQKDNPTPPK